jgi:tetratricopeptide (TPR) repeat protein
MTVHRAVGLVVLLMGVTTVAQGQSKWVKPRCDIKPGHFMVNSGVLYLINATDTRHEAQRTKDLRDADRVLNEAITKQSQDKNGAAWYYLGRYYGIREDLVGADSAFTRAQTLLPACKDDIAGWRKNLWTPVFNHGVQAFNAGKSDSAMHYFRKAGAIYPEPTGLSALAGLFANAGQTDSALRYYGKAAEAAATDPKFAKERKEALYNRGAVLYQNKRWDEARDAFRAYLVVYPNDGQALAALASSYAMSNKSDSALAIYQQILQRADSADPATLFSAGGAMFNSVAQPPDTATSAGECRKAAKTPAERQRCAAAAKATVRQHDSLSAGTFKMAAKAFEAGLARAPYSRDGLYNLTSTYYMLQDTAKMMPAAQKLIALDPMNRNAIRLAAAGFQMKGMTDSTVHYIARAESVLVADVTVQNFRSDDQSAAIEAIVTNFHDKPSKPFKIVFEFLKADGTVVTSQTVDVPELAAGGMHQAKAQAIGRGITVWRYRQE